jgi:S1-C subfamily serine protease
MTLRSNTKPLRAAQKYRARENVIKMTAGIQTGNSRNPLLQVAGISAGIHAAKRADMHMACAA